MTNLEVFDCNRQTKKILCLFVKEVERDTNERVIDWFMGLCPVDEVEIFHNLRMS